MAIKTPIVSIEVDDGAFQRFAALFARYQAQLKQMPGQWKSLGEEVDAVLDKAVTGAEGVTAAAEGTAAAASGAAVSFRQTYIMVGGAAEQLGKVAGASRDASAAARAQAFSWHNLARDARSFATHIGDATRSLLRWAGLTGLISGILGAGGLFGIERLATSAGSARRSALGLGVTPGEQSAFGINYGRVVDPSMFLGGVNDALTNLNKRHTLYGAGLSERDLAGKNTGQVAAELIPALKRIADQTPATMLAQVLQSRGLDQFITLEDFKRLKDTPSAEIAGYGRDYQKDAKSLNLTDDQLKIWQDLQTQFKRAGAQIQHDFTVRLTELAPALEHLSKSFVHLAEVVLNNPHMQKWIDDLAHAIDRFATYLDSPQVEVDINWLMGKIDDLGKKFGKFADDAVALAGGVEGLEEDFHKAEKVVRDFGHALEEMAKALSDAMHTVLDPWTKGVPPTSDEAQQWNKDHPDNQIPPDQQIEGQGDATGWDRLKSWWNGGRFSGPMVHPTSYRMMSGGGNFAGLEGANGLPPGLLGAVEKQESGGRDLTSAAGAEGYFQFMPATAARYGVNPHDEMSSARGAAHYFRDLLDQFGGDVAKAAAGYNWGEGNVQKDIAQYGAKWRDHLPAETSAYVNSITTQIANTTNNHGGGGRSMVTIQNNTGGNATVSTSQLMT